jgi:hypothetical protein
MEPIKFIIWTCAIIFAATGLLTIIGLIKKDFIQPKFFSKLFVSLIVEIIAISVLAYKQSVVPQKESWTIISKIHFLDEKGNEIKRDLRIPFSSTELSVIPQQIKPLSLIPYQMTHQLSGNLMDFQLIYTCKDSTGWIPAVINDLSKNSDNIIILSRDNAQKKLELNVFLKKVESPDGYVNKGQESINNGPLPQF